MGRDATLKERHIWSDEKPKLDNARRLRGIYFSDSEDKEFKETIRNARKIGNTNGPAMPCKTCKESQHGETVARLMISSPSLHVSWKPVNPKTAYGRVSTELP